MESRKLIALPEPWLSGYTQRCSIIKERLNDFSNVPYSEWFYELAFCILTPQSSQRNAEMVIAKLRKENFESRPSDPLGHLSNPEHYIRFHNVKSQRLLDLHESFNAVQSILLSSDSPKLKRLQIVDQVHGIGLKEASHFLRNVGLTNLAILDRHILKHLFRLGIISEIPKNAPSAKQYFKIEEDWLAFSETVGILLDELDLLFWSMETGEVKK